MGVKQTHVKGSHVDMEFMAEIARDCTCSTEVVAKILNANTARHVQEIITGHRITGYFDELCRRAHSSLIKDDQSQLNLQIVMFDFDGKVCGLYPKEKHSQL
jgi:cobalt-precorrin-5B (C1)-methyltransferase